MLSPCNEKSLSLPALPWCLFRIFLLGGSIGRMTSVSWTGPSNNLELVLVLSEETREKHWQYRQLNKIACRNCNKNPHLSSTLLFDTNTPLKTNMTLENPHVQWEIHRVVSGGFSSNCHVRDLGGGLVDSLPKHKKSSFGLLQHNLVGGWTNLFENYVRQIGSLRENNKYLKPPPSNHWQIILSKSLRTL